MKYFESAVSAEVCSIYTHYYWIYPLSTTTQRFECVSLNCNTSDKFFKAVYC